LAENWSELIVEVMKLLSKDTFQWNNSTSESVLSGTTLETWVPEQLREFAELRDDANNITMLGGWATSDLQADGIDRFNAKKQCV
jgi:hypothetical protein